MWDIEQRVIHSICGLHHIRFLDDFHLLHAMTRGFGIFLARGSHPYFAATQFASILDLHLAQLTCRWRLRTRRSEHSKKHETNPHDDNKDSNGDKPTHNRDAEESHNPSVGTGCGRRANRLETRVVVVAAFAPVVVRTSVGECDRADPLDLLDAVLQWCRQPKRCAM